MEEERQQRSSDTFQQQKKTKKNLLVETAEQFLAGVNSHNILKCGLLGVFFFPESL